MFSYGIVFTRHGTLTVLIYVSGQAAFAHIHERFRCVLRSLTEVPIRVIGRAVVREKVDIVTTLERSVASMQSFCRFVINNITWFHHNFVQTICMVKNLNSPWSRNILLGNIDNQTCRMSRLSIHMSQQPCTLGIFPHSIHIRRLELHSRPRLDQLPKTALPSLFEMPRNLNEIHIRFPIIDKYSLVPSPFLQHLVRRVAIVVIVRSKTGKHIIGKTALIEGQGAKCPFDHLVPLPFSIQCTSHFVFDSLLWYMWLHVIFDTHNAMIGHN
mmetsp:Transcript_32788/g.68949  ORF Transcript_32788/g.68949 Transcript_32788/m.68949 type:complete len:270 (-) Transcript_32788:819-1628(-)